MDTAGTGLSAVCLLRQSCAHLQLLGNLGKQVAALLGCTQNHQEHARVERRLGVLARRLVQVAHPIEQVRVDELNLADNVCRQRLGIAGPNKLGGLAAHMGDVLELNRQVVLRLVQVGVHLETVGGEAALDPAQQQLAVLLAELLCKKGYIQAL